MPETTCREDEITEKKAYILGGHLGDGYFCTPLNGNPEARRFIRLGSIDKDQVEYFAKCFSEFGLFGYEDTVKRDHLDRYWVVTLSHPDACDYIAKHCGEGSFERKHWPMQSFDWPKNCKLAFLAGLLDADGHICQDRLTKDGRKYPRWQVGYSTASDWLPLFCKFVNQMGIITLKWHLNTKWVGKQTTSVHMNIKSFAVAGGYFKAVRKQRRLDAYKEYHNLTSVPSETARFAPSSLGR